MPRQPKEDVRGHRGSHEGQAAVSTSHPVLSAPSHQCSIAALTLCFWRRDGPDRTVVTVLFIAFIPLAHVDGLSRGSRLRRFGPVASRAHCDRGCQRAAGHGGQKRNDKKVACMTLRQAVHQATRTLRFSAPDLWGDTSSSPASCHVAFQNVWPLPMLLRRPSPPEAMCQWVGSGPARTTPPWSRSSRRSRRMC
jgi:hypothetical protein